MLFRPGPPNLEVQINGHRLVHAVSFASHLVSAALANPKPKTLKPLLQLACCDSARRNTWPESLSE